MDLLRRAKDKIVESVSLYQGAPADEKTETYKRNLDKLDEMIVTLQKAFGIYAQTMLDMSRGACSLAKDISAFYAKSAPRQASVQTFEDAQFSMNDTAFKLFKEDYGWEVSKVFDDWKAKIQRARGNIRIAEDTRTEVAQLQSKVKSLESRMKKPGAVTAKEESNYDEMKERLNSTVARYQKMSVTLDASITKLIDGRYTEFDKCFVRLMESQMVYFQGAMKAAEAFVPSVENYRKRFPRGSEDSEALEAGKSGPDLDEPALHDLHDTSMDTSVDQSHDDSHVDDSHDEPVSEPRKSTSSKTEGENRRSSTTAPSSRDIKPDEMKRQTSPPTNTGASSNGVPKSTSSASLATRKDAPKSQPAVPAAAATMPAAAPAAVDLFGDAFEAPRSSSGKKSPTPVESAASAATGSSQAAPASSKPASKPLNLFDLDMDAAPEPITKPAAKAAARTSSAAADPLNFLGDGPATVSASQQSSLHDDFDLFSTPAPRSNNNTSNAPRPSSSNLSINIDSAPSAARGNTRPNSGQAAAAKAAPAPAMDFDPYSAGNSAAPSPDGSPRNGDRSNVVGGDGPDNYVDEGAEFGDMLGGKGRPARPIAKPIKSKEQLAAEHQQYLRERKKGQTKLEWTIEKNQQQKLNEIKEREQQTTEEREKMQEAASAVSDRLQQWEYQNGVRRNIRTLLTTLHTLMWPNSGWEPVSLGDVIDHSGVKKKYFKAVKIVHPDKIGQLPPDQKAIGAAVFEAVNAAWKKFDSETPH